MTDEERAAAAKRLAEHWLEQASVALPGVVDADVPGIAIVAAATLAVAFAAVRCVDKPAALALVAIVATTAAEDIYR